MPIVFQNPEWFILLALLPVMAILRARAGKPVAVGFPELSHMRKLGVARKSRAGGIQFFIRLLALACLITALTRPQLKEQFTEVEASGIDIVIALDISESMRGRDFEKDGNAIRRIDVAKDVTEQFIRARKNDRIGIIVFSSYPFLLSPLTLNHEWLTQNLDKVNAGMTGHSATAIGSAITMSTNRLRELKDAKTRLMIVITDGQNNAGDIEPIPAAEAAAAFRTKIYTIGVGTRNRAPVYREDENGNLLGNRHGQPILEGYITDSIDEETLNRVAEITDGLYFRADTTAKLEDIFEKIDELEKTEVTMNTHSLYDELFMWPALAGFCLFALELITRYIFRHAIP